MEMPHAPPPGLEKADGEEPAAQLSTFTKVTGVIALSLCIVLFALDGTMVSVAVPRMVSDLGGAELLSWIGTAYLLTSCSFGPLWGKLGDIFGRKLLFIINIVIFMLASLLCALTPNMIGLVVGRALQGIGGGGMQSLVYVLLADIVTMRERGLYQGLMGSIAGVAAICGPLLGGVITDLWSWRGIFWINLPLGTIAIAATWFAIKLPHKSGHWKEMMARVDYGGVILCVSGIVLFLFGLTSGIEGNWTSAKVIAPLVIGVLIFASFFVWEAKVAKEPSVPIHLFSLRNIGLIYAGTFFAGWNLQGGAYYLPLFFQLVYGNSPTESGLKTMPSIGALIPVSIAVGIFTTKTGIYTPFPKIGMPLMAIGIGLCATWTISTPLGVQMAYMVISGVGAGLTLSVLMLATQANLPVADIGPGTTVATFLQTIGGVLGIAVGGAIFQTIAQNTITPKAIGAISVQYGVDPALVGDAIAGMTSGQPTQPSAEFPQDALDATYALVRTAYVSGLTTAFISLACATAVGWLCMLFVRHTALKTTMDSAAKTPSDDEELNLDNFEVNNGKAMTNGLAVKDLEVKTLDPVSDFVIEEDVAYTAPLKKQ